MSGQGTPTPLSINQNCEPWDTRAHDSGIQYYCRDHKVPERTIRLRRIGWIDQAGTVWVSSLDWQQAGGPNGSITPLLINPGCD